MEQFSKDDLTFTLDDKARAVMLGVILEWARYDSLVSQWLLYAFGLSPDEGAILLGNMDTRTKLERVKNLYQHHAMDEAVDRIARLQKAHGDLVDVRNAIAHAMCAGHRKSDPEQIIFAPVRPVKGRLGNMLVEMHSVKSMEAAAFFAKGIADQLHPFVEPFLPRPPKSPPEPPELLGQSGARSKTHGKKRQRHDRA